jgi:voltage-gated potassium channel Kch
MAVLLVLGSALLTEHVGLSMAMGAFMAGLLIADSPFRHEVMAEIHPFRGLFLGLFFMSMGMSLNLDSFLAQPLTVVGLLVSVLALKFIVLWPLAWYFGLSGRRAAAAALMLSQCGEFGLILFAFTHQANLMSTELFERLLLVIVLSMLVTPPLVYLAQRLAGRQTPAETPSAEAPAKAPIVVAGFGRVGRRIGDILAMAGMPYVAIDNDPSRVLVEQAKGRQIFYGDARRPEVLRAVGAEEAKIVIATLNDFEATEDVVATLHEVHPDITILARAHDSEQCRTLRKLGATLAVSENFETSLELARAALVRDSGSAGSAETLLRQFQADYYAGIDRGGEPGASGDIDAGESGPDAGSASTESGPAGSAGRDGKSPGTS